MAGFAFMVLMGAYFLPTILAALRGNSSTLGVGVLNFFTGWTFVGWVVALVWALSGERDCRHVVYVSQNMNVPPYPPQGMPYGAQQPQQQAQWYVPPRQARYVDRGGPPMNVTRPRRGWDG